MNYGNDMTLRTPLTLYWRFVFPIKNQTIYLQAQAWKTHKTYTIYKNVINEYWK